MISYPLKFEPILQEKIWGGTKLRDVLNKQAKSDYIGESWEISGVEGFVSIVKNGEHKGASMKDLIQKYKADLVGERIYREFRDDFPLLIKFIDAKEDLSVQLHPHNDLAKERHNSYGKTEMWYVMQADQGARLNIGFQENLTKKQYVEALENGQLLKYLHFEEVEKGDSVFINTGKVHAIGAGVLLAEIQQTSDITYRIYDWNRVDSEGNSRELHTELALDAIDFERKDDYRLTYFKTLNQSSEIASCEYFTTNYLPVKGKIRKNYSALDSFVIYICVGGEATITTNEKELTIECGQSVLIPAIINDLEMTSENAELLEVYIQ